MIVNYLDYQKIQTEPCGDDNELPTPAPSETPYFVRAAVDSLSATSGSFLTTSSPLKASSTPPIYKSFTVSPMKPGLCYAELLERPVQSAREQELIDALRDSDNCGNNRKRVMIKMQASVILFGMYVLCAQTQLQAQETKKSCRKGKRKMGDGKAKYFTGDEFFQLVLDDEHRQKEEGVGKEQRKVVQDAHSLRLAAWKKGNKQIRERNEAKKVTLVADLAVWEVEKQEAKQERCKAGWEKPKWKDYGLEVLLVRPTKADKDDEDDEESENGSDAVD
ncbi:hypothetical protein DFH08DRAFT_706956 [Mycena albidolilacea]|uniref:Uncharacterized protein n=1 Tax=Mycena albidolilacea TaxID=1033008 RepID=A0AAD7EL60_9AGAR|nr:hypothetical protein DFH08DRAFT_706956 [Mycena albidolilacea]